MILGIHGAAPRDRPHRGVAGVRAAGVGGGAQAYQKQQLQQSALEMTELRQLVAASIQQRRQREQFILKQANEITRLRKLLP